MITSRRTAADSAEIYLSPQQLRAFVAVARRVRSRDRAAVRLAAEMDLHRSQPAVTLAVQGLEAALGVKLFERHGRSVRLTAAGEELLASAEDLLVRWRGLREAAEAAADPAPRGTLRIGAGEAVVLYLLPPVVQKFRRRWPRVEIVIRQQTREESFEELRRGEIDFAIRSVVSVPNGLAFEELLLSPRVVIAHRSHPLRHSPRVTVANLLDQPFVMPWEKSRTRRHIEEKLGRAPRVALEAGRWEAIKRYVAIGLGIAVVPRICLEKADARGLVELRAARMFEAERYGVVTREGREGRAAEREFLKGLRDRMRSGGRRPVRAR